MACSTHYAQVMANSTLVNFHEFLVSMCKIAKLSFVAGAEIPKRYLGV